MTVDASPSLSFDWVEDYSRQKMLDWLKASGHPDSEVTLAASLPGDTLYKLYSEVIGFGPNTAQVLTYHRLVEAAFLSGALSDVDHDAEKDLEDALSDIRRESCFDGLKEFFFLEARIYQLLGNSLIWYGLAASLLFQRILAAVAVMHLLKPAQQVMLERALDSVLRKCNVITFTQLKQMQTSELAALC